MILGPLAETEFRRAMTISNGDWSIFLTHPLSAFLLALAALGLLGPWLYSVWQNARARRAITGGEA
jgi:putative tricarboxylic transport membrane protein